MDDDAIRSPRNAAVQSAAALAEARERRARGQHLAEGRRAVAEAIAAGSALEVHVREDAREDLASLLADLPARVPVRVLTERAMARLATTASPPTVVAVVATPRLDAPLPARGPVLVLDALADPGNVGTLVRAADAAGCAAVVVLAGGADPFSPKAVRASAGSCYHLPVLVRDAGPAAVVELRATGRTVHGLAADAPVDLLARPLPRHVALVLGNEARGIAPEVRASLDGLVAVPMRGRAESLNVAAAGAIALFAGLVAPGGAGLGSADALEGPRS